MQAYRAARASKRCFLTNDYEHLIALLAFAALSPAPARSSAAPIPIGCWWSTKASGKVVDKIKMETGLPAACGSPTIKKTIYVTTNDHSGFEVIDVATHKVTNHFVLNDATHQLPHQRRRARSAGQGPLHHHHRNHQAGRPLRDREAEVHHHRSGAAEDRQDRGRAVQRPAKAAAAVAAAVAAAAAFEVSPDGKYLYQFGSTRSRC